MRAMMLAVALVLVACRVEPGDYGDADIEGDADCGWTDAAAVCGDGIVSCGEECDDGDGPDTREGDFCIAGYGGPCSILEHYCSDGVLDEGEECDDGNVISLDGCGQYCQIED